MTFPIYNEGMSINHEYRIYANKALVWVGRYRNLKNISHWHYDHELVVSEKGEALIHLDQNQYLLKQGECIFLRGQLILSLSYVTSLLYVMNKRNVLASHYNLSSFWCEQLNPEMIFTIL